MTIFLAALAAASTIGCAYSAWGWLMTHRIARVYVYTLYAMKDDSNLSPDQKRRITDAIDNPRSSAFYRSF
jgi:hypothetical protein